MLKLFAKCCCSEEVKELKRQMQTIEVDLKKEVKKHSSYLFSDSSTRVASELRHCTRCTENGSMMCLRVLNSGL